MGRLTDRRIRNLKSPGRHPDGETLYLVVSHSGHKSWIQRLVVRGHRHDLGLGPFPLVSLAEARRRAQDNRALARSGGDPMSEKQAAREFPHSRTWRGSTSPRTPPPGETSSAARSGSQPLRPTRLPLSWRLEGERDHSQARDTDTHAHLDRQAGDRQARPAAHPLRHGPGRRHGVRRLQPGGRRYQCRLARQPRARAHHRALPYGELPAVLRAARDSRAFESAKLAFEMLALTACRSGEVRGMIWDEVDLQEATWTIPGSRMKAGKPHRAPLSPRAMAILGEARRLDNGSGLIFPGPCSGGALCDVTFILLIRRLGLGLCSPRSPLQLPGLGGGEDQRAPRRCGDGPGSHGGQRHGGGLLPLRPLQPAPGSDGRVERVLGRRYQLMSWIDLELAI